jgi:hypothetical protein
MPGCLKIHSGSAERKRFMNFIFGGCAKCDSDFTFRIFALIQNVACSARELRAGWAKRQVVHAGNRVESFSLRETKLDVSLNAFAAPTALETSAD